jgi:endonuclease YncB( thermonuclease family)
MVGKLLCSSRPLPVIVASDVLTSGITVVDGDTVRAGGARYRLVGFDTPEKAI